MINHLINEPINPYTYYQIVINKGFNFRAARGTKMIYTYMYQAFTLYDITVFPQDFVISITEKKLQFSPDTHIHCLYKQIVK
jgi:hypothetical protein